MFTPGINPPTPADHYIARIHMVDGGYHVAKPPPSAVSRIELHNGYYRVYHSTGIYDIPWHNVAQVDYLLNHPSQKESENANT